MNESKDIKWPHPDEPVSLTRAARLLGVDRSTLERRVADILAGGKPRSTRKDVAECAEVYAASREGVAAKPPASKLMKAVGVDPSDFLHLPPPDKAPKERRYRLGRKEIEVWRSMPPHILNKEIRDAWLEMVEHETKNRKRRVLEIAEVMLSKLLPMPEKWITPESVVVFASMADWAARDRAGAVWPFILTKSGRPMDLLGAKGAALRGEVVFLDVADFASRLGKALELERAMEQREVFEGDAREPSAPRRARLGQKAEPKG